MYLRFVVPGKHADSGVRDGIFGAAYAVQRGSDLSPHEREELDGLLGFRSFRTRNQMGQSSPPRKHPLGLSTKETLG